MYRRYRPIGQNAASTADSNPNPNFHYFCTQYTNNMPFATGNNRMQIKSNFRNADSADMPMR